MDNPYNTSGLNPVAQDSSGSVTPGVLRALAATKPWVRFCSIIGFIGTGFLFLGAVGMLFAGGMGAFAESSGELGPLAGSFGFLMALVYVVLGVLYLFPSVKLWKYGSHIANLLQSNSALDLEAALDAQRSFWKFVSIMIIIGIVLYIVGIIAFVLIGVSMASNLPS